MEEKLVSIITPTYNCAEFIARTLDSGQSIVEKRLVLLPLFKF